MVNIGTVLLRGKNNEKKYLLMTGMALTIAVSGPVQTVVHAANLPSEKLAKNVKQSQEFNAKEYADEIMEFMQKQDATDLKSLFKAIVDKENSDITTYGAKNTEQIKMLWGAYIFFDFGFVGQSKIFELFQNNTKGYPQLKALPGLSDDNQSNGFLPGTGEAIALPVKNNADGSTFTSYAYYTPHKESITENADKTVVMHGGFRGNIDSGNDIPETRTFYDKGYNVLYIDNRATSKSGGDYVTLGQYESDDVIAWIKDYLNVQHANQKVVLYGGSMGAATMMSVLAKAHPENIHGLIENCGYASTRGELEYVYGMVTGLLKGFIKSATGVDFAESFLVTKDNSDKMFEILDQYYTRPKANMDINNSLPAEGVQKSKLTKLFIHGTLDRVVPFSNLETLEAINGGPYYEPFIADKAGHGEAQAKYPAEYDAAVQGYLENIFG